MYTSNNIESSVLKASSLLKGFNSLNKDIITFSVNFLISRCKMLSEDVVLVDRYTYKYVNTISCFINSTCSKNNYSSFLLKTLEFTLRKLVPTIVLHVC